MKRRTLLIGGVSVLGGCLESGADNTQGSNGTDQDEDGNGTDQDDHDRETRTYEIEVETSSDSPIQHEFKITQPGIHSPDSPLTLTVSISNPSDETIVYGDTDNVVGSYLSSDEFILIPKDEYEYSFDEDTRIWVATETIAFPGALNMDELEPDQTRAQELVLIRTFDEDSPDTIPSAFEFTTSFEVGDEDTNMDTNEEYTVAFSLVAT
ncbi:hypothetical protein [Saliphagus infecundisoli]|uniref:DUF4352 domain-containing protein n=1 Tax=Saliphagus infecundisoli TaxID=1849069 RepID=A0ABD5QL77_9EURY|nr:hypothetical protein [Saliphagus infecundisoli]